MHPLNRILLALLAATLSACATKPTTPEQAMPAQEMAAEAEASEAEKIGEAFASLATGDYATAIVQFRRLAQQTEGAQRQEFLYYSAEAMVRSGLGAEGQIVLEELDTSLASDPLILKRQLLLADIALRRNPERALAILSEPAIHPDYLKSYSDLYARYHQLRAQALSRTGNHLSAANEYVLRERYLNRDDEARIADNQLAIWQALSKTELEELLAHPEQIASAVLRGWVELIAIARNFNLDSAEVSRRMARWHANYPSHPAQQSLIKERIEFSRELLLQPKKIALLFSFSGRFGKAAEAVRDGILTAFYENSPGPEVTLAVYDIGDNVKETLSAYQQAVDEGAEIVIGPLDKEAVRQLAREPELPVTTLALNYAESALSEKLYQFTLSPEREARQVAERAWLEGHLQAAVIVPQGTLGERMNAAFSERWEELGGRIVSRTTYPPKQNDYSHQLRRLLNIDLSDSRRSSLARTIGTTPDFIPRRRQDVDFIFLAAFPRQARLIRPQLRFHHASDLPIYSTSYAFSGEVDRNKDRDMDGIAFLDMPWTLGVETPNSDLRRNNAAALARHNDQLQRLVAMGVDAFTLSKLLRFLEHFPYEHYQGETGKLSVLEDHQVRNKMLWARFQYGRPLLMEEISAGDDSDDELY